MSSVQNTIVKACLLAFAACGVAMPGHATGAGTAADEQLRERVQTALLSDPYFYGAHVDVSVEGGNVLLSGLVFSDWDIRDAMRIARKAAGGRRVIDDLTIVTGGRR